MSIHQFSRNVIAAIATLVFSTSVGAQAIIFQPVNTPSPIPTMSVVGMILLSLVIVGVAIYFRRRQATLMSLALAALGLGLFASQNDVIRAAWAAGFLTTSFESGQTEALLNKGPGQYEVTNTSDQPIIGQAVPSYGPARAAGFFRKIECFCFTPQTLVAGESRRMPVLFVLDPAMDDDVHTVTLSYTFFDAGTQARTTRTGNGAPHG